MAPARERLAAALAEGQIASAIYYEHPLHRQPAYAGFPRAPSLACAEACARRAISLPMHAGLRPDDQQRIISTISALVGRKGLDPER
jgi:perosamine synthetase